MEQKKGCTKCKKSLSKLQWYMIGLSIYVFVATIYGTIKIVENIISLF